MTKEKLYKKHLSILIRQIEIHLKEIDIIMELPQDYGRGGLIAKTCNNLNLVKDKAKRYGLELDFDGKPLKGG